MKVFECALRIIRGNIVFPLVYIVGLSFMGVFMALSFDFGGIEETLDESGVEYAVIDRDDSVLSRSIAGFLEERGVAVSIDDSRIAFQDAVAKGQADYLLVIPAGYEERFRAAVAAGAELPVMDAVFGYYSVSGSIMDEAVDAYLSVVRTLLLADGTPSMEEATRRAMDVASTRSDVSFVDVGQSTTEADRLVFYLQWSTYTLFAGIVVCVGMLIATMNRTDVRRRNLASPLGYASYNLQLALSCGVFAFASCAWTILLGALVFPSAALELGLGGMALLALSVLGYALMALAFGFMLGQFGASALVCNALGNIIGMVISFMGGAWMSLDLLSPQVVALSRWLPGYWYIDGCQAAARFGADPAAAGTVLLDAGILALFAIAFLAIGFVAAKQRLQTSEAGGNRAAQATATL